MSKSSTLGRRKHGSKEQSRHNVINSLSLTGLNLRAGMINILSEEPKGRRDDDDDDGGIIGRSTTMTGGLDNGGMDIDSLCFVV